jgi:hypothetical protein
MHNEWDLAICYASEDIELASKIYEGLHGRSNVGAKEVAYLWGHSLNKALCEGLKIDRAGCVKRRRGLVGDWDTPQDLGRRLAGTRCRLGMTLPRMRSASSITIAIGPSSLGRPVNPGPKRGSSADPMTARARA